MEPLHHESAATNSIALAQSSVQPHLIALMALCATPMTLAVFERRLFTLLLTVGREATALFFAHAVARESSDVVGVRTSIVATRFGRVPLAQPVQSSGIRPVARALQLHGGASFGVIIVVAQFCARLAFAQARAVFAAVHQWRPSQDMTLRIVDATGALARGFLEQAALPSDDGEVLVIEVDGRGAPMITPTELLRRCQPRRPKRGTRRKSRKRSTQSTPSCTTNTGQEVQKREGCDRGSAVHLAKNRGGLGGTGEQTDLCDVSESRGALCVVVGGSAQARLWHQTHAVSGGRRTRHLAATAAVLSESNALIGWGSRYHDRGKALGRGRTPAPFGLASVDCVGAEAKESLARRGVQCRARDLETCMANDTQDRSRKQSEASCAETHMASSV